MYASTLDTKVLGASGVLLVVAFLWNNLNQAKKHRYLEYHTHEVNQQEDGTYDVSLPKNHSGEYLYLSGAWY